MGGRLGFLVDISPDALLDAVDRIFTGDFDEEYRFLLAARIGSSPDQGTQSRALNDVVLHKWNTPRMVEFETYIDDKFVNAQRSDGLIVSTPTGSTAYALSGGGPILHPKLDAITLVPICPHTLSNRPIVVHDESVIKIIVHKGTLEATVSCDGQISHSLQAGDHITIRKHRHSLRLLHPPGHDYFAVLREKLGWSEQP